MFCIILFIIWIGKLPPQYMDGNFWIFLIVDIAFACIEIVVVVLSIIYWHSIRNEPTLRLKQFLSLYRVDPSRWYLYDSSVEYHSKSGVYIAAKFASYFDYHLYRYMRWRSKIHEEKATALKKQADFVKLLQSDLTLTREEIDEAIKNELKKCEGY
jgi:hypothetical protein